FRYVYGGFYLVQLTVEVAKWSGIPWVWIAKEEFTANRPANRGPTESGNPNQPQPSLSIGVLQEIGQRCGSKVEYRSILSPSRDWQFSYETRKDAQQQAAENALRSLADKYVAYIISRAETLNKDPDNQPTEMENGLLWETDSDEDVENSSEGIYGQTTR
nr:RNA polymerase II C-terminal domain phosphatase-like 2 isoform X2 [Tanacetum cinerariifolium]